MIRDPGRVTDGFASLERGVDSGKNPSLLPRNQVAWAENLTFRGGYVAPRPGWRRLALLSASATEDFTVAFSEGKFQGAEFFDDATSRKGLLVCQSGGRLFRLEITNQGAAVMDITPSTGPNSGIVPQVWMVQAENYLVVQDGQSRPMIFDGSNTRRAGPTEVPMGSGPMAYGMLRLWVAQGRGYVAGDVAGGPTGVLSFTENDYLAEGGAFSLPMAAGNITAMRFTATPNTSLGQGELLLFTPDAVFSNTAPVDRDAWKNLTQPLQTITLINNGGQSQSSTVLVNGDVFMRARDGLRSVIQAVRHFSQWGNTPLSNEVKRVLDRDSPALLGFASAVEFDNRLLLTCQPAPLVNGCFFRGVMALDFELVTSMADKLPPAYDGLWTGPQIYQLVKGRFAGVERCFAFARSETDGFVERVLMVSGGSGYTTQPSVIAVGGGGAGATFQARMKISAVTGIAAAGSGYAVDDILTLAGVGLGPYVIVTAVDGGGGVTGVTLIWGGDDTAIPDNPLATTTNGAGVDCTLNVTWSVKSVTVITKGAGYTSRPTLEFNTGNASAVAVVDYRMELWELTRDGQADYNLDESNLPVEERISWFLESPSYGFNADRSNPATLKRLETGDLWVDRVTGTVDFTLHYRPDQYPCWSPWHAWQVCAARCVDLLDNPCGVRDRREQYRPRMILPQPPESVESVVSKSMRTGYEFSVRLAGTGFCRVKLLRLHAKELVETVATPVAASETECGELSCGCD